MALQRRLERARRDALLYAAMVCEDHIEQSDQDGRTLRPARMLEGFTHAGQLYAAKLREIAK